MKVMQIRSLDTRQLTTMVRRSQEEGYRHITRLADEYVRGENTFSNDGEALFVALDGGILIGICGLNRDPFLQDDIGRVRRLYVMPEYRRLGIGKLLVYRVIETARGHYRMLMLRTDDDGAALFYERIGFEPTQEWNTASHKLMLGGALP